MEKNCVEESIHKVFTLGVMLKQLIRFMNRDSERENFHVVSSTNDSYLEYSNAIFRLTWLESGL